MSTAVSTYVRNGITLVSTYGETTVLTVSYIPATTKTVTTTTTTISVSISNKISTATVSGPTITASAQEITITKGGGGAGGYITITGGVSTVISYVYPSSSSSSFTCRTYATNYLNGMHGKVKRMDKRSIFDTEVPMILGEMLPRPGAVPKP